MDWQPSSSYRYVLKRGMSGADVAALQINLVAYGVLSGAADGAFGPMTELAAKNFQERSHLTPDGLVGLLTQRALCLALSQDAVKQYRLPDGLLTGIMANESGFAVGAYASHGDGGFDLGPYQMSFPPMVRTQANYVKAYNVKLMSVEAGKKFRTAKDSFRKAPKVSTDKRAWELAILSHNWPAAADNLANLGSINRDASQDDQSQNWILAASGGAMSTPRQWVDHYIQKSSVFITSWPA